MTVTLGLLVAGSYHNRSLEKKPNAISTPAVKGKGLRHGVGCLELNVNTFCGDLKFTALNNLDGGKRLVSVSSLDVLDLVDDIVALEDLAEDNMTAVQPTARLST